MKLFIKLLDVINEVFKVLLSLCLVFVLLAGIAVLVIINLMKTPSGGEYSEAHFFDENWNYTTKDKSMYMVIKEFNIMDEVINELIMSRDINFSLKR